MKSKKLIYGICLAVAVVAAIGLGIDLMFDPDFFFSDIFDAGGALLAVGAPAAAVEGATAAQTQVGTVGTNVVEDKAVKSHPEMNKDSISTKLSKIMPSNYPLDTLLRNIGSGKTKSDHYGYYSITNRGTKGKVATKVSAAETDSPIQIVLSEGCQAMSKDGCLFVPSYNVTGSGASAKATKVTSGLALHPLNLHIVDINHVTKTITVVGVNAKCPALDADTELYRMASAKDQDAAMSDDPMATPTKEYNWVQRNLCTISENVFQALQEKEVTYGMAEFKEQALLDFRMQAEMTALFGGTSMVDEFVDPISQKRKLFMRGLLSFNINNIARDTAQTEKVEAFLNRAMEKIFSNNNGSESRLLLYGPQFATEIANSGVWQKQLEAAHTEVRFGITWKVIETNFGQLLGIMHPGLGLCGPYSKAGIVIDPANIRRIEQLPLQQTTLDLKKAGIRNSKDVTLDEAWTLEVTNPLTHALLAI